MIPDDLIQLIDNLISDELLRKSKCNQNILNIDGMCGITTRHLYNNICYPFTFNVDELIFVATYKFSPMYKFFSIELPPRIVRAPPDV